ncbi:MAG: BatD family protein [Verrucomicrobium sp.]
MNSGPFAFPLIRICTLLGVWLLMVFTPGASAAGPKISATIEPAEIQLGGFALYVITIEEGNADAATPLVLPNGVELAHPLPSTGRPNTGSRFQYASTITWQLTSESPGEHTIAAQEIHINGIPFRTNPVKLVVKDNGDDKTNPLEPLMTLEAGKRQIYVGEVIPVTVNLYAHRQTFVRRIGLIELPKDNFAIQRFPTQPNESIINIGNTPYRAYAFQSTLSALKPGKFDLGPASAEVILDIPSGSREPFLHPLLNQMEPRKVRPTCNEIDIHVLPLPEEGKPKGFHGLVGDFEVTMTAEPKSLNIGDPISVDITISGKGNFDALTMPAIVDETYWRMYPPKKYNVESPNTPVTEGEQNLGFTQVIVPKSAVETIPSFEFTFFSPTKKQYVTLRTKPVAIHVKGTPPPATPPAPAAGEKTASGGTKPVDELEKLPPVKPTVTDILTVMPTQATWLASRPVLWRNQNFIRANAVAAGFLALLIMGKLASSVVRDRRNRQDQTSRQLWKELNSRSITREQLYTLAVRYGEASGVAPEVLQRLQERHEVLSFSATATDEAHAPAPESERTAVLAALKGAPLPVIVAEPPVATV